MNIVEVLAADSLGTQNKLYFTNVFGVIRATSVDTVNLSRIKFMASFHCYRVCVVLWTAVVVNISTVYQRISNSMV